MPFGKQLVWILILPGIVSVGRQPPINIMSIIGVELTLYDLSRIFFL